MPLYDVSYRKYEGPRSSRWSRSFALARSAAALLMRRRSFLLLLAACWIPAVVRAAQIYVSRQFPQAPEFFAITPATWREFLGQQVRFLPVVLVSLATGASAIASDFASGALLLYLSKPISRFDYLLGKSMVVMVGIAAVTLAPALALLGLYLALAPNFELLREPPWLFFSIVGYSLFLALYFSLAVLAVSSLCRSGRVAGAGFAAIVFGSEIVSRAAMGGRGAPPFVSMIGSAVDAGYWFFDDTAGGEGPFYSVMSMVFVMVLSAWVLNRRLRSGEGVL
ncbi:MAG: ABC transporter permease subunit [Vicinamibacteria bacterium]